MQVTGAIVQETPGSLKLRTPIEHRVFTAWTRALDA
jgi:hypothetical protein